MDNIAFKLAFEDGSEVYLEHFGVKGMKWGVWNEETRARRTSAHRFKMTEEQKDAAKTVLKAAAVGAALVAGKVALDSLFASSGSHAGNYSKPSFQPDKNLSQIMDQAFGSFTPKDHAPLLSDIPSRPSLSTVSTGEGIMNQLMNADIPENLLKK